MKPFPGCEKHIDTPLGDIYIANTDFIPLERNAFESEREYRHALAQLALNFLVESNPEIVWIKSGAPIIANRRNLHVSLSYSWNRMAIYLSEKQVVGVDLQTMDQHIDRLPNYFLHEEEQAQIERADQLFAVWGAKEAAIKISQGKVNNMKSIRVQRLNRERVEVLMEGQQLTFAIHRLLGCCLVYSV